MSVLSGAVGKNGQLITVQQYVRSASVIVVHATRNENVQVNGYTFILDLTGVGAKHLAHWATDDMRSWQKCWQVYACTIFIDRKQVVQRYMN